MRITSMQICPIDVGETYQYNPISSYLKWNVHSHRFQCSLDNYSTYTGVWSGWSQQFMNVAMHCWFVYCYGNILHFNIYQYSATGLHLGTGGSHLAENNLSNAL